MHRHHYHKSDAKALGVRSANRRWFALIGYSVTTHIVAG